jgi:hypothetical protein
MGEIGEWEFWPTTGVQDLHTKNTQSF